MKKVKFKHWTHTQPLLPLRPGQVERHAHDYVRHGTTYLFAALERNSQWQSNCGVSIKTSPSRVFEIFKINR